MRHPEYEDLKAKLRIELLKMQNRAEASGERIVILFEGRDAAGKGGTIERLMERLNPRGARVVALEKPSGGERGQWYFQRYIAHLPTAGEIVPFDRSWYDRRRRRARDGLLHAQGAPRVPAPGAGARGMLVNSGVRLFKLWFSVSREEQAGRFKARQADPLKRRKLDVVGRPDPRIVGRARELLEHGDQETGDRAEPRKAA